MIRKNYFETFPSEIPQNLSVERHQSILTCLVIYTSGQSRSHLRVEIRLCVVSVTVPLPSNVSTKDLFNVQRREVIPHFS